jgi:hypothetical protein
VFLRVVVSQVAPGAHVEIRGRETVGCRKPVPIVFGLLKAAAGASHPV